MFVGFATFEISALRQDLSIVGFLEALRQLTGVMIGK